MVVLVEFWYQECQHMTCMELRKCSGIGRVLVLGNVSMWHMEYRKCSGMGGVFSNRTCEHMVCLEHRKCGGMGGILVQTNVSMWHVWSIWSTRNVVVWMEFWYKEMSACGMYEVQET